MAMHKKTKCPFCGSVTTTSNATIRQTLEFQIHEYIKRHTAIEKERFYNIKRFKDFSKERINKAFITLEKKGDIFKVGNVFRAI